MLTVFTCSAIPAEEVPPQTTTNLSLEWREAKSLAITMDAQRLGYANRKSIENPYPLATVMNTKCSLHAVSKNKYCVHVQSKLTT